ncbi:MAG: hypothetical protein WBW57_03065 [Candidatus Sulfotelmatobacter sp.]
MPQWDVIMPKRTIYTLDARGNVMLEVMRDHFHITPAAMRREIQGMLAETEAILNSKGIRYSSLKSALVPSSKRREIALVFDTSMIKERWYGLPIHEALLPLFSRESTHSVLAGDYIGGNAQQEHLYEALTESTTFVRETLFRHSSQFFIIYINNLSEKMFESFDFGLRNFEPYVGFADLTYSSFLKFYLSTILVNAFIKHRNLVLMGHEDDRDSGENVNMAGYPFEKNGFSRKSLQSYLFGVLLSYKIERPVTDGFETDTEFSLNAVNVSPLPFSDFEVRIDRAKFDYLLREKAGSLQKIGLLDANPSDLENTIKKKISSNCIYNMCYDDEHGTTKFDLILEMNRKDVQRRFRAMLALEYVPQEKRLRLITMY